MTVLIQLGLWLLRKLAVALAIAAVMLLAGGLVLYLNDNFRTEEQRQARAEELRRTIGDLRVAAAHVEEELAALRGELEKQRRRAEVARELLESYEQMNSFWDWLFGTRIDPQELEARRRAAEEHRSEALERIESIVETTARLTGEHADVVARITAAEQEAMRLERDRSPLFDYALRAWREWRWVVAAAVAAFLFGPTIGKVFAYYAIAPLIGRASPIRIETAVLPPVKVESSGVSRGITLAPGEAIFVRERFLQASDESLRRRTRFVLDWHIPVTCAACGLIELVELRNETEEPAVVTVSAQDDTAIELAEVTVPAGGGIVLRPSFLAAVIPPADGGRLEIRRHWRLFHLQSWLTLQFRHFQFRGPCRLIVAGSRGVRAERIESENAGASRGRRTNQDSTIGFTPDLACRCVRAETFWAYYRGRNPLFDDLFQGSGTFLCQEVAHEGAAAKARRFWSRLWDGVLKVFGV